MIKDVTELKVSNARIEEKLNPLDKNLRELKSSTTAQIWTLIGILLAVVGGLLIVAGNFVITPIG